MTKDAVKFNLEKKTINNTLYRKVVYTDPNIQLVFMSLNPGEFIHGEKHPETTQFFRIEKGQAIAKVENKTYRLKDGDTLIVPPGAWHEFIQTGTKPVKFYTIYSPPEHPPTRKNRRQPEEEF